MKRSIADHVFSKLKNLQKRHSKINQTSYQTFEAQGYMKDQTPNNHEVSLLFALRSRTALPFKAHIPYNNE